MTYKGYQGHVRPVIRSFINQAKKQKAIEFDNDFADACLWMNHADQYMVADVLVQPRFAAQMNENPRMAAVVLLACVTRNGSSTREIGNSAAEVLRKRLPIESDAFYRHYYSQLLERWDTEERGWTDPWFGDDDDDNYDDDEWY